MFPKHGKEFVCGRKLDLAEFLGFLQFFKEKPKALTLSLQWPGQNALPAAGICGPAGLHAALSWPLLPFCQGSDTEKGPLWKRQEGGVASSNRPPSFLCIFCCFLFAPSRCNPPPPPTPASFLSPLVSLGGGNEGVLARILPSSNLPKL